MKSHFVAASVMLDALVRGDLDGYHGAAAIIAAEGEHGPVWSRSTDVRDVANRAREATTLPAAALALADLAVTCGSCHRSDGGPHLEVGTPPSSTATGSLRMARHQWAATRMWHGLMQPSEAAWSTGSEVFASSTLVLDALPTGAPPAKQAEAFALAARAHAIAQKAKQATGTDDRRRIFAEMYTTCAECHAVAAAR